MANFTTKYNKDFSTVDHFNKLPQMMPWVGEDYDVIGHKRLLVIGESFYFPEESNLHLDSEKWYSSAKKEILNEEEISYTNTVELISNGKNQYYEHKPHWIYKNIENAILESGFSPEIKEHMFRYIAYCNYFQRPAELQGESVVVNEKDMQVASSVLISVINIIKPDYICFTSSLAWKSCIESGALIWDNENHIAHNSIKSIVADRFPHPTSMWWNRKSESYLLHGQGLALTGKEKFIEFLKFYEIF